MQNKKGHLIFSQFFWKLKGSHILKLSVVFIYQKKFLSLKNCIRWNNSVLSSHQWSSIVSRNEHRTRAHLWQDAFNFRQKENRVKLWIIWMTFYLFWTNRHFWQKWKCWNDIHTILPLRASSPFIVIWKSMKRQKQEFGWLCHL